MKQNSQRKKIIVANWKMNPQTLKEAEAIFSSLKTGFKKLKKVEIVVCPPFVYLSSLKEKAKKLAVQLGAQNCFWEEKGAFTGEISPLMLRNMKVSYVIIGHSERRRLFFEDDEIILKKVKAVLKNKMTPIICVGETKEEREKGLTFEVLKRQTESILKGIQKSNLPKIILAYEPVWAIGTGSSCSQEDAVSAILFLRKLAAEKFGKKLGNEIRILYGGSVNQKNVGLYLSEPWIDGVLIGSASLHW
jgi:triosephosphate isomerase